MGLLDVGQKIWVRDPEIVWRSAEITASNDKVVEALDDNGQEHKLPLVAKDAIDHKEAWFLANPANLTAVEDLTELSYLHEPAVLNTLRTRYLDKDVYTYCGIVLVAINPFEDLPIYTERVMREYHGKQMGELEPHLYALAEAAYSNMANYGKNSSIVISGESGAGKTVSAVHCMRYFATVGGSGGDSSVESKVLASNPIMEAFGNAKTTRNNNSSRFGKYISLQFDSHFAIQGAVMYTYLLEKSRVVFQAPEERSYHIFYQLCASAWENCPPEFADFELEQCTAYKYISGGNSPEVEKVDDAATFEETREALTKVGIDQEMQVLIFKLLATILHIGNIELKSNRQDEAQCDEENKALLTACRLLDVAKPADFAKWLCRKTISTGRERIERKNTLTQALASRDAFAKHLYATLFDYIVLRINKSLETTQPLQRFIGVLDIYGFELFKINSFEQFCINYANEKLQQQFNQHVFKLEQEEYRKEKIEWSFIDFYDNQPCIDLIEDKLGILSLLDEEARLPKGSDESFLNKMIQNHEKKEHFSQPRFAGKSFIVKHFAADVEYQVENFLEKNKDAVSEELMGLLTASSNPLIQELFGPKGISTQAAVLDPKGAKKTVGAQFKQSLTKLMETIYDTTPHYCRCIKPNQSKKAFLFEEQNTIEQLRACGVLETVRISAAGYPSRWEYGEFLDRYSLLLKADELDDTDDMKERCQYLLHKTINEDDKFQFGITKIFFRAGVVAYLEKLRGDRMKHAIVMMQRNARRYVVRAQHVRQMTAIAAINRYARGMLARREAQSIREWNAATRIQAALRGHQERKKYLELRDSVVAMQTLARALLARKRYLELKEDKCATMIQAAGRMYVARQQYRLDLQNLITIQNQWRCREARREFRQLKGATKDVAALKDKFKGLEQKLMELQQRLDAKEKENARLKEESQRQAQLASSAQQEELHRIQAERDTLKARVSSVEAQLAEALSASQAVSASVAELQQQLDAERESKAATVAELQARLEALAGEKDTLDQQVAEMKKERKKNKRTAVLHSPVVSIGTAEGVGGLGGPEYAAIQAENAALKQQVEQLPALTGEIESLKKKLAASAAAFMVAEKAMTPVHERVVVPDPEVVAELEKMKVENAALKDRLATAQSEMTAGGMAAKLDAALAGKSEAEGEQARLQSMVAQLRLELEDSAARAPPAVPHEVVKEVKVSVPDPAVVAELEKLKVEYAAAQERIVAATAELSQDDAAAKLDRALAGKAEADGEVARLSALVAQYAMELKFGLGPVRLEEDVQLARQSPEAPSLSDEGVERLAALDKENAELKRRLANSAVAIEQAQKPVEVEKLVTDPALVAEVKQLKVEREMLQQRLDAALAADSSAAAVDVQLAEAADARMETTRLASENDRLEKRVKQLQQELESTRTMASAAAAAAAAAAEIVAGGESQAPPASGPGGDSAELLAEMEKLKEQNKRLQAAADHSVPKDFVDSLRERHADEVARYVADIRELQDQVSEYDEYFAQHKQNARGSGSAMRRTPSVTAKQYDEYAQADANGSVSSDDADIEDVAEDKEMLGMFIWNEADETRLIQELIVNVTPPKVRSETPGFVAYVLFMCVRWADHMNNAHQLQNMLTVSLRSIKHSYSKNLGDLDVLSFWLSQNYVLLSCMYFSSDEDGDDSSEYALEHFDIEEYLNVLTEMVTDLYGYIIKLIQPQLSTIAVPALLEYEEVAVEATTSRWSRRSKKSQAQYSFQDIIKTFEDILRVFKANYLNPSITESIFTQLAYFVGATCLNALMLRKDLCTFQKACQMQINVQHVTNWLAQNKLETAMNELMPLLQAVKLLMVVPTSVDEVETTRSMCANLNCVQIQKLLTMYTPDSGEDRVPVAVIRAIEKLGREGRNTNLVADLAKVRPLALQYIKPTQKLTQMEAPTSLNLGFLEKV